MAIIFLVSISYFCASVNGEVQEINHTRFVKGVDHALQVFTEDIAKDNKNLARLSEGYLNADDVQNYQVDTNFLEEDNTRAMSNFCHILSGSTGLSTTFLKEQDISIVKVYTTYITIGTSTKMKFHLKVLRIDGTCSTKMEASSLEEVQNKVDSFLGIQTDLASGMIQGLHMAQVYDRQREYRVANKTVSSYNTYICIAKHIPCKGRYSANGGIVYFDELQTYSSGRWGVNEQTDGNFK